MAQYEVLGFGGNTACLQVGLPDGTILIIDGGTGLRNLGIECMQEPAVARCPIHFLMTHFHWDHIQGIRVAQEANVKRLILFHHDPSHTDAFLEALVAEARLHFPNTDAAKEGWSIRV
jgi:phosphoribosyl 1,2-cyclic phosphodiesterase